MKSREIIKVLDGISSITNSGLTKLPVIPNTKGTYVAQYCVDKGLHGGDVTVFRVYPNTNSIGIYFLDPTQENCRNLNSSNYRQSITSNDMLYKKVIGAIAKVYPSERNTRYVQTFIKNVKILAKNKANKFRPLEVYMEEILGGTIKITPKELIENTNDAPYSYRPHYDSFGSHLSTYVSPKEALECVQKLNNFIENSKEYSRN